MKLPFALLLFMALLAGRVAAQSAPQKPHAANPSAAADTEWASIKHLGRSKTVGLKARTEFLREADRLKDFYTKYPAHAEAKNAKGLEGLALIRAWQAGDATQSARREQVVGEMRRDKSLAVPLRAELFAFADHVAIAKRKGLTQGGRLLAYEEAVRALIAEFPGLPNGYESLVRIAHDSAGPRATALASEIARMPAAPDKVKVHAQVILARFALIGESLPDLARPLVESNHPLVRLGSQPVFVYAWASSSAMSIRRAKTIAANAPAGAVMVGICLDDRELSAAQARAAVERLPGQQVYDALGHRGALARKLELTEPGLIYAADATGTIRSVTVQNSLNSPLITASQ